MKVAICRGYSARNNRVVRLRLQSVRVNQQGIQGCSIDDSFFQGNSLLLTFFGKTIEINYDTGILISQSSIYYITCTYQPIKYLLYNMYIVRYNISKCIPSSLFFIGQKQQVRIKENMHVHFLTLSAQLISMSNKNATVSFHKQQIPLQMKTSYIYSKKAIIQYNSFSIEG